MWQDLLFSYNIAVDRSEEMKRVLGKSAASVGLQLPDVYQPWCSGCYVIFQFSYHSYLLISLRIVAFVVVWLLGCCIFQFTLNSSATSQVDLRFYTLFSTLETEKLSCVVCAGWWIMNKFITLMLKIRTERVSRTHFSWCNHINDFVVLEGHFERNYPHYDYFHWMKFYYLKKKLCLQLWILNNPLIRFAFKWGGHLKVISVIFQAKFCLEPAISFCFFKRQ